MKKGFMLLELLIALTIAAIVTCMVSTLYLKYNSIYEESTKFNRDYSYGNEALMFIGNEIKNSKSINVNNNVIEVKYTDGITKKYIKANGLGSLVIVHTENGINKAVNNVLTNISDFTAVEKSRVLYVTIIIGGEKYEKCFGINLE